MIKAKLHVVENGKIVILTEVLFLLKISKIIYFSIHIQQSKRVTKRKQSKHKSAQTYAKKIENLN